MSRNVRRVLKYMANHLGRYPELTELIKWCCHQGDCKKYDDKRASLVVRELLLYEENWVKVLMGIALARFDHQLVNRERLHETPFTNNLRRDTLRDTIDDLYFFGRYEPKLALIVKSKIRDSDYSTHFKLTPLADELLRNLIFESSEQFKKYKRRKSGGAQHIWLVEQVKKKLRSDGWEIYAEEETFYFSKKKCVYFDLQAYQDTPAGRKYRIFECETGKDVESQIQKNIWKCLKLGKYSGNRINIICSNLTGQKKIINFVDSYFAQGAHGYVQVCTLTNFLRNRDWSYVRNTGGRIRCDEDHVGKSILESVEKYEARKQEASGEKPYVKKINKKLQRIRAEYTNNPQENLDELFRILDLIRKYHKSLIQKVQEVKFLIRALRNKDRVLCTGLFYSQNGNRRFIELKPVSSPPSSPPIPTLEPIFNGEKFSRLLNKNASRTGLFTKDIEPWTRTRGIECKLIQKNNILIFIPISNHELLLNFFCIVNQDISLDNLAKIEYYVNSIEPEAYVAEYLIKKKLREISEQIEQFVSYNGRSLNGRI